MWKIYYNDNLVGFGVTTDLAQFEKYDNFVSKGGIRDAKGLYITSIAGDNKYSGVVGLLFGSIDNYANDNNYDYLLLEAKKYEPNYLVGLYSRYGFTAIKELTEDGEIGTLMCKDIKEGFKCNQSGGGDRFVVHILGPSGSGKTTLGLMLAKLDNNIVVLDTDDIDDKNSLKILNKYDLSKNADSKKFLKLRDKLNKKELDKFLEKNKHKNIIFVGFDFGGMEKIPKIATHKYSIKVDAETVYRQYHLRTIEYISKNKKAIEKLLINKNMDIDNIRQILLNRYKIRQGFDCIRIKNLEENIKNRDKKHQKNGYKLMTKNDIYKHLSIEIKEK